MFDIHLHARRGIIEIMEHIKECDKFPGYGVTNDGRVFSRLKPGPATERTHTTWRQKKTTTFTKNMRVQYERIVLRIGKRAVNSTVHRMVLETFRGPCPYGCESRHINGNSLDNRLENLEWGTKEQNSEDKRRHGTMQSGDRNGQAKISRTQANAIRERRPHTTLRQLARDNALSLSQVKRIVYGTSWVD
jgi:hypothetical protein